MVIVKGPQARVFYHSELLYHTNGCKQVHKISDDLFVLEETGNTLTFVYCTTLIVKIDKLVLYRIMPNYGVLVYEDVFNQCLGTLYTKNMQKVSWFIQEEHALVFLPQGYFNILRKAYRVIGFERDGSLVLENQRGQFGVWNYDKQKFIKDSDALAEYMLYYDEGVEEGENS